MKGIAILGFVLAAGFSLAGASRAQASDLEVLLSPRHAYVLPGRASSCTDLAKAKQARSDEPERSVAGNRISVPAFGFVWRNSNQIEFASATVHIESEHIEGGAHHCQLEGSELALLLGRKSLVANGPDAAMNLEPARSEAGPDFVNCSLSCGGIRLKEGAPAFTAQAHVLLKGFVIGADGNRTPIRAAKAFAVEYSK